MAGGPRPDPPPRPQPPPPPPPPATVHRAPPPPVSSGPTAAQIAASRQAAARAQAARLRAERAKKARARKAKAAQSAAAREARLRAERLKAGREAGHKTPASGLFDVSEPTDSASIGAFAFIALGVGVALLGLALVPAYAVPWYRVARALEDRRGEIVLMGALGLFLAAAFFLLQVRSLAP